VTRQLSPDVVRSHDEAELAYLLEERAAIKQESGTPREQAEAEAFEEVVRAMPPCVVRRLRPQGFAQRGSS